MERRVFILMQRMRERLFIIVAAILLGWVMPSWAAESRLVVVASAKSPIQELTLNQVRKLYLGVAISVDGREIMPLRNGADPLVKEMFLQKVLYMSASQYERHMVTRVFRSGGERIPEATDIDSVLRELYADPRRVTFMLSDTMAHIPSLKIVGELWRGE